MIRPTWVYRYRRVQGTVFHFEGMEGPGCYAPLVHFRKKKNPDIAYLYLGPPKKKGNAPLGPRDPRLSIHANGKNISGIFEPSPEYPGKGFGNIERRDALLTVRDDAAGELTIYVFPGLGMQDETLFLSWHDGGVSLEAEGPRGQALYNNGHLDTKPVAPEDD